MRVFIAALLLALSALAGKAAFALKKSKKIPVGEPTPAPEHTAPPIAETDNKVVGMKDDAVLEAEKAHRTARGMETAAPRETQKAMPTAGAMKHEATEAEHDDAVEAEAPEKRQRLKARSPHGDGVGKTSDGKTIYKGAKGGRFYLNASGHKVYIKK